MPSRPYMFATADRLHAQRAIAVKRLFAETDGIDVGGRHTDMLAMDRLRIVYPLTVTRMCLKLVAIRQINDTLKRCHTAPRLD